MDKRWCDYPEADEEENNHFNNSTIIKLFQNGF